MLVRFVILIFLHAFSQSYIVGAGIAGAAPCGKCDVLRHELTESENQRQKLDTERQKLRIKNKEANEELRRYRQDLADQQKETQGLQQEVTELQKERGNNLKPSSDESEKTMRLNFLEITNNILTGEKQVLHEKNDNNNRLLNDFSIALEGTYDALGANYEQKLKEYIDLRVELKKLNEELSEKQESLEQEKRESLDEDTHELGDRVLDVSPPGSVNPQASACSVEVGNLPDKEGIQRKCHDKWGPVIQELEGEILERSFQVEEAKNAVDKAREDALKAKRDDDTALRAFLETMEQFYSEGGERLKDYDARFQERESAHQVRMAEQLLQSDELDAKLKLLRK